MLQKGTPNIVSFKVKLVGYVFEKRLEKCIVYYLELVKFQKRGIYASIGIPDIVSLKVKVNS